MTTGPIKGQVPGMQFILLIMKETARLKQDCLNLYEEFLPARIMENSWPTYSDEFASLNLWPVIRLRT